MASTDNQFETKRVPPPTTPSEIVKQRTFIFVHESEPIVNTLQSQFERMANSSVPQVREATKQYLEQLKQKNAATFVYGDSGSKRAGIINDDIDPTTMMILRSTFTPQGFDHLETVLTLNASHLDSTSAESDETLRTLVHEICAHYVRNLEGRSVNDDMLEDETDTYIETAIIYEQMVAAGEAKSQSFYHAIASDIAKGTDRETVRQKVKASLYQIGYRSNREETISLASQ